MSHRTALVFLLAIMGLGCSKSTDATRVVPARDNTSTQTARPVSSTQTTKPVVLVDRTHWKFEYCYCVLQDVLFVQRCDWPAHQNYTFFIVPKRDAVLAFGTSQGINADRHPPFGPDEIQIFRVTVPEGPGGTPPPVEYYSSGGPMAKVVTRLREYAASTYQVTDYPDSIKSDPQLLAIFKP